MCALRGDDGSVESNQWWQSLRHPVRNHSHGAEHRANLQHGNTHPDMHTFTHTTHTQQTKTQAGSHSQSTTVDSSHARSILRPQLKGVLVWEFFRSSIQTQCSEIKKKKYQVWLSHWRCLPHFPGLENKSWSTSHSSCRHVQMHQVQISNVWFGLQEMLLEEVAG